MTAAFEALVERAAERYRAAGRYSWHFARGKLRGDPLFRAVSKYILPLTAGRVLDLGCGRGLLFSWLAASCEGAIEKRLELHGVELHRAHAEIGQRALAGIATIECADIREAVFPASAVIVIGDVLLYLSESGQEQVLQRVARALDPGGVLLMREADAGGGFRFHVTEWAERLVGAMSGRPFQKLHYRRVDEWRAALARLGFIVTAEPMSQGTPFRNVLYVARKA
jgi:SAM-dependent methyltransferase